MSLRKFLFAALFALIAAPVSAQPGIDHTALVRQIKAQVVASGINPDSSECARFEITKRVAWALRGEGVGLIAKNPAQNGCDWKGARYGVDAVVYATGEGYDIIGGGPEGPNTPHWLPIPVSGTLWRAPIDPNDSPVVPPVDLPVDPPNTDLVARVAALEAQIARLQGELFALHMTVVASFELNTENHDVLVEAINRLVGRVEKIESRLLNVTCVAKAFGLPLSCRVGIPTN